MAAHILIVEDEEKLARFVELELVHEGYEVSKAGDGRTGLELALANDYDLILQDIMLPGINGLEALRRLKREKDTPVILLTARDAVMDKVAGLDQGAVDYITKPFAIEELLARIRVALKLYAGRKAIVEGTNTGAPAGSQAMGNGTYSTGIEYTAGAQNPNGSMSGNPASGNTAFGQSGEGVYRWKELTLDIPRHEVRYAGQEIVLTNREFKMLETLLSNMDIVLSRDTLLERACGYDYLGETNVVDVYIRYLRAKIDDAFDIKMIQTVRGVGYVIKSE